jgi:hypothetical protein
VDRQPPHTQECLMTNRWKPPQLYHPPYAERARQNPGAWVHVRTYENPAAATFIATTIRDRTHPAYREAPGRFIAEIRQAGGGYALWISYQPAETT